MSRARNRASSAARVHHLAAPPRQHNAQDHWKDYDSDGAPTGNCATGHIDFDVFPHNHDDLVLNVEHLTWRAVDCPVGDDLPIQFAFSTTTEHMNKYSFAVHLWDLRARAPARPPCA